MDNEASIAGYTWTEIVEFGQNRRSFWAVSMDLCFTGSVRE